MALGNLSHGYRLKLGLDLNKTDEKMRNVEIKDKKMKIYGLLVLHFHQGSKGFLRTSNPTLEFPSWGVESHQPLHFYVFTRSQELHSGATGLLKRCQSLVP